MSRIYYIKNYFQLKKKQQNPETKESEVSLVCTEIFVHGVRLGILPLLRTQAHILQFTTLRTERLEDSKTTGYKSLAKRKGPEQLNNVSEPQRRQLHFKNFTFIGLANFKGF